MYKGDIYNKKEYINNSDKVRRLAMKIREPCKKSAAIEDSAFLQN